MRVSTLEAYNITNDILQIWREGVGDELLPVQERAIKEYGLFGDQNLIVFSPTSSGKTFIGEMAMVRSAKANAKVFYLVPQKALAEEKYQELQNRYEKADIRVVVSSRDRREFDDAIAAGDFNIAVVVFEKLAALLIGCPQLLEKVGLVVVDELQLITDETRGPALELLLTKLKTAKSKPRIVGLSAVLGKANLLANWLEAKLLVDTQRPVELRKGVLCKGTFKYREHNSGTVGTEAFADMGGSERKEIIVAAAEDLVRRGEQVLVFLADRASTVTCARILADRVSLPVSAAIEELGEQEQTHAQEALRLTLNSSIAFHNSDLSLEERSLVEKHFRAGNIRALFATSTLAVGMNLPVKNVLLEGQKWHYFKSYHRWGLKDMSRSEYENMSGRAGRLGLSTEFGRSILVTNSKFQADVLLEHFAAGDFEEIVPTLAEAPMEDLVVDLLASGLASRVGELNELLLSSYTGVTHWTQKLGKDELGTMLEKAVDVCVKGNLATLEGDVLTITRLGRACASKGIGVHTGAALARWATEASQIVPTTLEIMTVAAHTKAGEDVYVTMPANELNRVDYRGELLRRARELGVAGRPVFVKPAASQWAPEYEEAKAYKKALLLCDWIEEQETRKLEESYHVWAGAMRRIGEEFSWIIEALGAIAATCNWTDERKAELFELSNRLLFGVRSDAVALARLRVMGVGRILIRRLVRAGYVKEQDLLDVGPERVRKVLNHRGAFEKLWLRISRKKEVQPSPYPEHAKPEVLMAAEPTKPAESTSSPESTDVLGENEPVLVVDLKAYSVRYRGHELPSRPPNHLQRQLFLALAVLASKPTQAIGMDELADEMLRIGELKKRPVAPDARDLRYRVLRAIKKALSDTKIEPKELEGLIDCFQGQLRLGTSSAVIVPRKAA